MFVLDDTSAPTVQFASKRPAGKPTLASADDPRPALQSVTLDGLFQETDTDI